MDYKDLMCTGIIGLGSMLISIAVTMAVLICLSSCNRQQSYGYWNGIYQPPPQEINDYERP